MACHRANLPFTDNGVFQLTETDVCGLRAEVLKQVSIDIRDWAIVKSVIHSNTYRL